MPDGSAAIVSLLAPVLGSALGEGDLGIQLRLERHLAALAAFPGHYDHLLSIIISAPIMGPYLELAMRAALPLDIPFFLNAS